MSAEETREEVLNVVDRGGDHKDWKEQTLGTLLPVLFSHDSQRFDRHHDHQPRIRHSLSKRRDRFRFINYY